jgi:uncharacterized radical SAM superfamily Fe-S cluster-containing enzyme
MQLYGKLLRFKRGITLSLSVTFRCNLSCSYCTVNVSGKRSVSKEATIDEMIEYINHFPVKIKEIYITGGEPSLRDDLPELVNKLLDRGYFIVLFTNLKNLFTILKINKSVRFRIQATYHHKASSHEFYNNYLDIIQKHRIDVDELKYQKLYFSKVKQLTNEKELDEPCFRIAPDLTLWTSCLDMYKNKKPSPGTNPNEGQ